MPTTSSILPEHLRERTRRIGVRPENAGGDFVLYWMRTAVRAHENPALDVALLLANARRLPVLVYHALSERYPYASDRHHTFILEGARDVARELATRGIPHAFHLEREGARGPYLRELAARAVAVVTEDFPAAPFVRWTQRLAEHALVAAVDTACVVPMKVVGRAYDRAFAYERATKELRRARVSRAWIDVQPELAMGRPVLPFTPVDLERASFAELVASAAIDHGVGPVAHSRGGSVAGYARFRAFALEGSLGQYARERNDPLAGRSSRLSAYLHYGHVSPLRIAREVAAIGGAGAQKFLDELLVWREVAYAFTAFTPCHDDLSALPAWARETLAAHATDARAFLPSWETLARGKTGDALWDAAQAHLRTQGELHNNVRMTWGKALVEWTRDPAAALAMLVDLNHRYALDGRDPASYGGLLWCLGQFDRPFTPERPVLGTVRARPLREHARRLDVAQYAKLTQAPATKRARRIAIVGAGLSGLVCARTLSDHGHVVTVFDKGRCPGGRATSRHERDGRVFDHGAQFFTARGEWLLRHVASWEHDGVVARWSPRVAGSIGGAPHGSRDAARRDEPWWVGTPRMGSVASHLARALDVRLGCTVTTIARAGSGADAEWSLTTSGTTGEAAQEHRADALVLAIPAAQCAALLAPVSDLAREVGAVTQTPCWAVMLAVRGGAPAADVFEDRTGPVAWAAREGSKPGRTQQDGEDQWVLHASTAWSEAHLEASAESVTEALASRFMAESLASAPELVHARAHRWRFARSAAALAGGGRAALFDATASLAVCGDWLVSARVEAALASGVAAAGLVLGSSRSA